MDRPMRISLLLIIGLSLLLPATGCSKAPEQGDGDNVASELPDWLEEDEARPARKSRKRSSEAAEEVAYDSAAENDRPAHERPGRLELKLNPGDRFPLTKVVDVELAQASLNGPPEISRRRLELMLMIEVADRRSDRTQLRVKYERVKYSREVAGEKLEYDSRTPPAEVPFAVRMYHDMVRDGFAFWLNQENQIVEAEDFKAFLNRCLRNIPEEKRQQALLEAEGNGENGITDFIDNSIALLPFGYRKTGDSWDKTRNVSRPIPMVIRNTYRLEELNDETAIISITGKVGASTTTGESPISNDFRVTVTGGQSMGECTVFRDTGLPRSSRVETLVDMLVQAQSVEFRQQQRTVTTIESYPVVAGAAATRISARE
ncbi:hypothetical protein Pan44_25590 [Caulifigura coniformis]|uniref:Lipoprotein n=2 Tax=Caulifigura coniformis TaxID=2527983 RepID=A0A517SEH5_9PLAN|nr:hypothetical protein Pan44_25590 [Caulifigura coniformis]